MCEESGWLWVSVDPDHEARGNTYMWMRNVRKPVIDIVTWSEDVIASAGHKRERGIR